MNVADWTDRAANRVQLDAAPALWPTIWEAWKAYARRAGRYQSLVLLTAIYYLVFGPSALLARLVGTRLLDLDTRARSSYWSERKPTDHRLSGMRRQF